MPEQQDQTQVIANLQAHITTQNLLIGELYTGLRQRDEHIRQLSAELQKVQAAAPRPSFPTAVQEVAG